MMRLHNSKSCDLYYSICTDQSNIYHITVQDNVKTKLASYI